MKRKQEIKQIKNAIIGCCVGISALTEFLTEEAYQELDKKCNLEKYKKCFEALDDICDELGIDKDGEDD